ncbi:hypothetical protein ACFVIY_17895 [Streptomyces sp. NPDC127166]|uniref:hypothetical protein n=1 Tax=Streptomyces sp. NPDC127166 TaxID=3345380 RepID=UPI00362BD0E2
MNPEEAARRGLSARQGDEQGAEAVGEPRAAIGPQTGVWSSSPIEIYHWDAEKTAEVARILAEHPPRDYTIATTVGQVDEPPPAAHPRARCRCAHARDLHNSTDCAGCTRAGHGLLANHAFIAREDQPWPSPTESS